MAFECCVPGCKTTGIKIFHSFPKDKLRCKRWIFNTKCFNINCETAFKTHSKVCKIHFKADDYTSTMHKYLKSDVVPSLHLPELDVAEKYICPKNGQIRHDSDNFAIPFIASNSIGAEIVIENLEIAAKPHKRVSFSNGGQIGARKKVQEEFIHLNVPFNIASDSTETEVILENLEIVAKHFDRNDEMCLNGGQIGALKEGQNEEFLQSTVPFNIPFDCTEREVILENLEVDAKPFERNDQMCLKGGQIGAQNECLNEVVNEDFEMNSHPPEIRDKLKFAQIIPDPYLTDDVEDNEFYMNNNKTAANTEDSADKPSTNFFNLSEVLVPEVDRTSKHTREQTEQKSKGRTMGYDPAARRARYQATRIKFLTQKLRNPEKLQQSKILDYLEKKLTVNQMTFVRMQIKNAGRKPRGHRFSFEEKCMAFAIFKQSPKCYRRLLSKILTLPCKQTLMKHSALVRFEAGINPTLMSFLTDVVQDMNERDKIVTLGWDELALTAHLDHCKVKDYIDGFVDDGKETTDEFATHALVFMVRGVRKSYKQPISYFFTQNINKDELAELIVLVNEAVMDVGLKVIGSVCDAVATNLAAVRTLIDPKLARLPKFCLDFLEYRIRNTLIIHYFDPPHLIKTLRNNMLTKDLYHYVATKKCSGKKTVQINWDQQNKVERVASWDDVTEFYEYNQRGINQLLTKITDEHIAPNNES